MDEPIDPFALAELELPPEIDWEEEEAERAKIERGYRRVLRQRVVFGFVLGVLSVVAPIVALAWLLS